ncbi:MAG: SDR family oxidoreductase [Rhodospirillales bacterium]|nr:SDR family oxidoreductase [Rhodospirillales bacterium]
MTSSLISRTCLVTGGSAGIGFVTARELARLGAEVTIVARNVERGRAAAAAIHSATGAEAVEFVAVDLSDQGQVRDFADAFRSRHPKLDVLVNNAGGLFGERQTSVDGIEMTFALNHLSYFLLSHLLLPSLQAAAAGRIVNVASEAHRGARLDFDDLQGEMRYSRWHAYKRSKLANLMFTYEFARRFAGRGPTMNALHPGFVATDIGVRHGFVPKLFWTIGKLGATSPEKGAETSIYLASAADVAEISGRYFVGCRPAQSSAASYDREAAQRLWDISANLTNTGP